MAILKDIEAAIPGLRRYAHALVRDRDAADDLVQDCLERAVARRADWRGEGPLKAWLFRILLNCHRDQLRRRPDVGHLVTVDDLPFEPSSAGGQDAHMSLSEVGTAIDRLPVDQRRALLLVALEGMSVQQAALALEIPEGTLMSRIARARASLRSMTDREINEKAKGRP
ncbi:MAG: RNA polymerase subunit sigma [Cereibacter sphaeroides]|uniref:RNA polymerase subunit sigma n=1 Tax=Cereibacter sphaeroides TaxID=1063 RepID=A0A2W5SMJ0_CERSP|nr:MAG: RNA polymerase subunit sigma [Cereibacter sphaeroides]